MRYPNGFVRTHIAGGLRRQYAPMPVDELERLQPVVAVGGRLVHKSAAGDASRGVLQDSSGRIDILVSAEATGKANHAAFEAWKVGDIVGAGGILCRPEHGELAVRVHEIERLVEAVRPLPRDAGGAAYLALLADERARHVFELRTRLLAGIRAYLGGTSYLEVETPLLQAHVAPAARGFTTHHNALGRELHLRTSGETYLKRLLVGGIEKVYEINRHFSSAAPAPEYFPEGTLLEIYCAYSSYLYMMALLEQLLARAAKQALGATAVPWQAHTLEFGPPFRRIAAAEAGPRTGLLQPTFVIDVPAREAPRARRKDAAPELAEQFELFIGGQKIAEGRSELNDPDEVAAHYDADFTRAVEYGLPPASGVAVSIDRLAMVLSDSRTLRDVVLFPAHADR